MSETPKAWELIKLENRRVSVLRTDDWVYIKFKTLKGWKDVLTTDIKLSHEAAEALLRGLVEVMGPVCDAVGRADWSVRWWGDVAVAKSMTVTREDK